MDSEKELTDSLEDQDFRGSAKAKRISSAIVDLSYLPGAKKC